MTKNKQSQLRLTCEARDPCYEIKITLQKANKKKLQSPIFNQFNGK